MYQKSVTKLATSLYIDIDFPCQKEVSVFVCSCHNGYNYLWKSERNIARDFPRVFHVSIYLRKHEHLHKSSINYSDVKQKQMKHALQTIRLNK